MLWLLLFTPLVGSALCGLLHFATLRARRGGNADAGPSKLAGVIACAAIGVAFGLSVNAFFQLAGGHELALESSTWKWIDAGEFRVDLALVVDHLSSVMLLVITGVGFLIHVYSIGYMHDDPGFAKFFAYLNLFVFAMLMLVLS